jgi:hypothetical protein
VHSQTLVGRVVRESSFPILLSTLRLQDLHDLSDSALRSSVGLDPIDAFVEQPDNRIIGIFGRVHRESVDGITQDRGLRLDNRSLYSPDNGSD